ncbi:hypothetical protein J7E73_21610 [Paenibacillus albidus]|uniref:hypothetical protein n=1 Tax=Paenibacillus albidus TaxID=2041023 RepID=UPI001BE66B33|nr:hypothetical protein [Paenibacillus albidus]MBT2291677.1 hypothetical protein [Paenibacillus albidus]
MIYGLGAVVFLLLLAAGILAYQNSKLISSRTREGKELPGAYSTYSVYQLTGPGLPEADSDIPLFRLTVPARSPADRSASLQEKYSLVLCRLPGGQGEMRLGEAKLFMLSSIRELRGEGIILEYKSFADLTVTPEEAALLRTLEEALSD